MVNDDYLLALNSINGLGPVRLRALVEYFKDPKLAWEADGKALVEVGLPARVVDLIVSTRRSMEPPAYLESLSKSGIKWLTIYDENYPRLLKQIYDPPVVVFYKGDIQVEDEKAIAVVGSRKMGGYGRVVTEELTRQLVEHGFAIISGLARGVDSQAHKTAVNAGGRTLAVLGGGLNKIYPPENIGLAEQIINGHGAVISEFSPDEPSLPGNFPARNRIISGLSKAVLVTEADSDSGSLITARLALEQGREVFAVPGPITSSLSRGPIDLIKEGARPVSEIGDILDELGLSSRRFSSPITPDQLPQEERLVLAALENENLHIDEVCRKLNFPSSKISALLLKMELSGLVRSLGGGVYCRG